MKKNMATKVSAVALALLMASGMSACNGGDDVTTTPGSDSGVASGDVEKPAKISAMMTTTMTFENGLQHVCDQFKENTGIELVVEKPDHNQYYEKVTLSFAGGEPKDVLELGSTYYPNYAISGGLWDMTDAWESSTSTVKEIADAAYVDALKVDINGEKRLFGFPMAKGNGTCTYVRQDWLDELGVEHPTTYDEFLDMLRAFKTMDGVIPLTAAGLINSEAPYDIYLREFYQDATPGFYLNEDTGKYVDGMTEDAMKDALTRMREAYSEGLIDLEIVNNKTSTCREKFTASTVGCFNYWAGSWCMNLENDTKLTDPDAKLVAIKPIQETKYIERVPTAMAITTYAENPLGIYKYFLEYSHDGGEGQMLFTHGVADKHYTKQEDGTTVALPYYSNKDKLVEKSFYSPELTYTTWDDPIVLDERVTTSLQVFNDNRIMAPLPITSEVVATELPNLEVIKNKIVSKIVLGEITVDEGIEQYKAESASAVNSILEDLNK